MHEKNRLFSYIDSWGEMPVEYANEDCYIALDSDGYFGIYRNDAAEFFMEKDMIYTGNIHEKQDYEVHTWLQMLIILRDMWRK